MPEPRTVLGEAEELVYGGDRETAYGHPAVIHKKVSEMWRATFGWDVATQDVALAMILLKMAREKVGGHKRDNSVDMGGYVGVYARTVGDDD